MKPVRRFRGAGTAWQLAAIGWLTLLTPRVHAQQDAAATVAGSPAVRNAIARGVGQLYNTGSRFSAARSSVVAYALLKAGEPVDHPLIADLLARIQRKVTSETYRPAEHHVYEAGVDAMALEAADPEKYRPELQAIAAYLVSQQQELGYWDYPNNTSRGDTSISQYGMLGLWAASRAGVEVPLSVWDRAAAWHLRTQQANGGFSYHPLSGAVATTHSMTAAGTGSLLIARMFLYPDSKDSRGVSLPVTVARKEKIPRRRWGVLERIDDEIPLRDEEQPAPVAYRPVVTLQNLDAGIDRGIRWMGQNFTVSRPTGWPMYFMYGLERLGALSNRTEFDNHNWYAEGADQLVRSQLPDGRWTGTSGDVATCFGLLFLSRATAQSLHHPEQPVVVIGSGLLAGGRGLPKDLTAVESKGGKVVARKSGGTPLDELLKQLANPKTLKVESTQTALVEAVQVGDRAELIGQTELLKTLVNDRRVEVRRTAVWALARGDDIRVAPLLIAALEDPDVSVMVEARNALCVLGRNPGGFGLPDSPLDGVADDAADGQKQAAIDKWRKDAVQRWREWYRTYQPYDERDALPQRR